jgi:hypothetical protein
LGVKYNKNLKIIFKIFAPVLGNFQKPETGKNPEKNHVLGKICLLPT